MPLDAICLAAVREELSGRIIGQKIDKVQQPERDVLILSLRGGAGSGRLLISAGSDMRVHMTEHRFDNPDSPPMFCMLLRKHITGARISAINQPPAERVLTFVLDAPDAMGIVSEKRLILELIGRSSNVILTDNEGIIIDCLRRVGGELSDRRSVLPGLLYREPPVQEGKLDPLAISESAWKKLFDSNCTGATVDKWLLSAFSALSPLICRELSWRAYGDVDFLLADIADGGEALNREFFALIRQIKSGSFEPYLIEGANNMPGDFSFTHIMQYENIMSVRREEGFSEMLDSFFTQTAQITRIRQRAASMVKTLNTARGRLSRKLIAQEAEIEKSADRDSLRESGDIIMANMHMMKKGQRILAAHDFFSDQEGKMREIALDPLKTPQQNAAKYYKAYSKAKSAVKYLSEQVGLGSEELKYIDSVLEGIARSEGERDLQEIRRELMQTGYVKAQKQAKEKQTESAPLRFESSTGVLILAGKNNAQNDKLTMKTASKSDVWLHAQKIHGAHVIISGGGPEPDEATLYEAAAIAAYYSSARSGGKVPVDYTLVKNVKKPPGGRPGMVTYTAQKTIIADPDESLVKRLRKM